jgi:hypothetical protein
MPSITPLFICGTARSGTTLLVRLLDGHPQLAVIPDETYFFARVLGSWIGAFTFRLSEYLMSDILARRVARRKYENTFAGHEDFFIRKIGAARDLQGIRYWVEKTPSNERFVEIIEHQFKEQARFIHIIRDPRDVVASWLLRSPPASVNRARTINRICHTWAWSAYLAEKYAMSLDARYRVLIYEELVREGVTVVNGLAKWLDVIIHEALVTPTQNGLPHVINSSNPANLTRGQLSSEPVGRHVGYLTGPEIREIEYLLGPQMSRFGYKSDNQMNSERRSGFRRSYWPFEILNRWHILSMQQRLPK